jgi:hypothetical protein
MKTLGNICGITAIAILVLAIIIGITGEDVPNWVVLACLFNWGIFLKEGQ